MNALRSETRQELLAAAAAASHSRTTSGVSQLAPALRNRLLDQYSAECLAVEPVSDVFDEDYKSVYAEFYTPYFNEFVRAILRAVREGQVTPDQIHELRYNTQVLRIRNQVPHLITPEQVQSGLSKIAANENAREMALSAAIVATKELLGE